MIFTIPTKHIFELDNFHTQIKLAKGLWIMWITWCITLKMNKIHGFLCG